MTDFPNSILYNERYRVRLIIHFATAKKTAR